MSIGRNVSVYFVQRTPAVGRFVNVAAQGHDAFDVVGMRIKRSIRRLPEQLVLPAVGTLARRDRPCDGSGAWGRGELFADDAGQTVGIVDPKTNEVKKAEIFVATLGPGPPRQCCPGGPGSLSQRGPPLADG